jgi:hypothetical protein
MTVTAKYFPRDFIGGFMPPLNRSLNSPPWIESFPLEAKQIIERSKW